jgi:hypothetical protein
MAETLLASTEAAVNAEAHVHESHDDHDGGEEHEDEDEEDVEEDEDEAAGEAEASEGGVSSALTEDVAADGKRRGHLRPRPTHSARTLLCIRPLV